MGQILVRNLDDATIKQLKSRAARNRKSLEQTLREIIADAVRPSPEAGWAEIDRIRAKTPRKLDSSLPLIRAFRDGDDSHS
jgi:plasmid stability protein